MGDSWSEHVGELELHLEAADEPAAFSAEHHLRLEPRSVRARVGGYRGDPPHVYRLTFGWRANVVLDV